MYCISHICRQNSFNESWQFKSKYQIISPIVFQTVLGWCRHIGVMCPFELFERGIREAAGSMPAIFGRETRCIGRHASNRTIERMGFVDGEQGCWFWIGSRCKEEESLLIIDIAMLVALYKRFDSRKNWLRRPRVFGTRAAPDVIRLLKEWFLLIKYVSSAERKKTSR